MVASVMKTLLLNPPSFENFDAKRRQLAMAWRHARSPVFFGIRSG